MSQMSRAQSRAYSGAPVVFNDKSEAEAIEIEAVSGNAQTIKAGAGSDNWL